MPPLSLRALLPVAAALAAAAAGAQERPSEDELFGAPSRPAVPAVPPAAKAPEGTAPGAPDEAAMFAGQGPPAAPPPQGNVSRERDDTLRVGGQLYLRAATTALEDQEPGNWRLSSPNLLDVYLDARPNDRVRGFVLGRLSYDPTLLPEDPASAAAGVGLANPAAPSGRAAANPVAVLDQLWVNFDVERRVFVTVGRQHAKWGVGRFWNPTDYLHPVRRNPLAVFDERAGTTLVKVHVPWEARGWNVYGVAVFEDLAGDPPRRNDGTQDGTNRLGRLGAGGRVELVLGGVEVGADALVQAGHRPRFGVDVSTGLWDLDVYAEAALRTSVDTPRWRAVAGADPALPIAQRYERRDPLGFTPQIVAGATYAVMYSDEDAITLGAEYFYDRSGYESARVYPVLLGVASLSALGPTLPWGSPGPPFAPDRNPASGQPNPFTPFYLGRHYGGAFVSLPAPGGWNDTTLTLSVLGNLSDKSFVARLDHAVLALTYLKVETYVAGHLGAPEGEFRLGFDVPAERVTPNAPSLPFRSDPMVLQAGVAVRVSL